MRVFTSVSRTSSSADRRPMPDFQPHPAERLDERGQHRFGDELRQRLDHRALHPGRRDQLGDLDLNVRGDLAGEEERAVVVEGEHVVLGLALGRASVRRAWSSRLSRDVPPSMP